MPKDIPTLRPITAYEDVLLTHDKLTRQHKALSLLAEARQRAKQLLKQAEVETQQIRTQAWMNGYQDGVIAAASSVANHIDESENLLLRFHNKLGEQARAMLSASLDHPDLLLILLDEWLRGIDTPLPQGTLQLQLPLHRRAAHSQLLNSLQELWGGKIQIEYHADTHFVMRYADQIAQFSPDEFIAEAAQSLLHGMHEMPAECRSLSQASMQSLQNIFTSQFSTQPQMLNSKE
ncbi:hypothetical protein [Iodobacter fluviatilis]|uniref:Oxygen-regulated invasion protein OrgB n=1 Tax=Iodobacter fluviatilis TaxID=537 RepID=A0A377Q621_9NEIS|nr:hypothetical protein [Iodobacter fluviatilis]TCU86915.1 hypothetical protein EV682_10540 [Iodobacter fluviatilis]STQ90247.1 Oxygen-regulated invasion protein OrgB [Iodobacter fluviatilis]